LTQADVTTIFYFCAGQSVAHLHRNRAERYSDATMQLFRGWRRAVSGYRLLRGLMRTQDAILAEQRAQTLALQSLAASVRLLVQQEIGAGAGFVTGPADGKELSGLVRTSDQELSELLEMETKLARQLGRTPSDDEVVAAWADWREGL
jgi:hypothetical protein